MELTTLVMRLHVGRSRFLSSLTTDQRIRTRPETIRNVRQDIRYVSSLIVDQHRNYLVMTLREKLAHCEHAVNLRIEIIVKIEDELESRLLVSCMIFNPQTTGQ